MRLLYLKFLKKILLLVSLIKISNSQNITDLIKPKCNGSTIKYSILANLSEYLENEKNIDKRELYKSLDDLKTKKIGTVKDLYFNKTRFDNIIEYDLYESMEDDLRKHNLDAFIVDNGVGNKTQMFTNDLSLFPNNVQFNRAGFGVQKDNTTFHNILYELMGDSDITSQKRRRIWLGINYEIKYINKSLIGYNGTINFVVKIKDEPFAYRDKNGEITGSEIDFIYSFARKFGYKINLIEVNTYDEQVEFLKNKSADIAAGNFIIRDDKRQEIGFTGVFHPSILQAIVRYENLPNSSEWEGGLYESEKELDGEKIGILSDSSFEELTKKNFPKSEYAYYDGTFELYQALLMEEIEGFLMDEPNAEYFQVVYPERITYFPYNFEENIYAFGFQKNEYGIALLNEFNQFLSTVNLKEIYDKWNVEDISNISVDKNLNTSATLINAAFLMDLRPLCFMDGIEIKGYEIELLYKFAKERNYNLNLTTVEVGERITYIQEGKANISGGWFTVTDERKNLVNFSNPIHNAGTVLSVRVDGKKDKVSMKILDNKYNVKTNNTSEIKVKFSDKIKTSNCIFPDKYNDTILINCTISDINDIDPYSEGMSFLNTSDKLNILYYNLELNNFFQANTKIPGHNGIIKESDKNNFVCESSKNDNNNNGNNNNNNGNNTSNNNYITEIKKRSSNGLSTGPIIAIAIPSIILLLGVLIITISLKRASPATFTINQNSVDSIENSISNKNLKI